MWKLLSDLEENPWINIQGFSSKSDKKVTKLLKTIDSRDFKKPPDHSNLVKFPVWETVCVACRYANIAGWDMPPSRTISGYLPNNESVWLGEFYIKWDDLRVLDSTSGEDLLNLLKIKVPVECVTNTNPAGGGGGGGVKVDSNTKSYFQQYNNIF